MIIVMYCINWVRFAMENETDQNDGMDVIIVIFDWIPFVLLYYLRCFLLTADTVVAGVGWGRRRVGEPVNIHIHIHTITTNPKQYACAPPTRSTARRYCFAVGRILCVLKTPPQKRMRSTTIHYYVI